MQLVFRHAEIIDKQGYVDLRTRLYVEVVIRTIEVIAMISESSVINF